MFSWEASSRHHARRASQVYCHWRLGCPAERASASMVALARPCSRGPEVNVVDDRRWRSDLRDETSLVDSTAIALNCYGRERELLPGSAGPSYRYVRVYGARGAPHSTDH